jgi:small subunit ribosomal protein S8
MSVDVVGNFLTIIRNATMVSKPFIVTEHSMKRYAIAKILKDEGFVKEIIVEDVGSNKKNIKVVLKYYQGESVIHAITRISTPGRRVYVGRDEIQPVIGGLGLSILNTNKGVLTHKQAKQLNVGGEIVCTVW